MKNTHTHKIKFPIMLAILLCGCTGHIWSMGEGDDAAKAAKAAQYEAARKSHEEAVAKGTVPEFPSRASALPAINVSTATGQAPQRQQPSDEPTTTPKPQAEPVVASTSFVRPTFKPLVAPEPLKLPTGFKPLQKTATELAAEKEAAEKKAQEESKKKEDMAAARQEFIERTRANIEAEANKTEEEKKAEREAAEKERAELGRSAEAASSPIAEAEAKKAREAVAAAGDGVTARERASFAQSQMLEESQKKLAVPRATFEATIAEVKKKLSDKEKEIIAAEAALKGAPKNPVFIARKAKLTEEKIAILKEQVDSSLAFTRELDAQITELKKYPQISSQGQIRALFENERRSAQLRVAEQLSGQEKELKVLLKKEATARAKALKESQKQAKLLEKEQKALDRKYAKELKKFNAAEKKRIAAVRKKIKELQRKGQSEEVEAKEKEISTLGTAPQMASIIERQQGLKDKIAEEKSKQKGLRTEITVLSEMTKPAKR